MDSKKTIKFIAIILIAFPVFVFANSQDYLFVSFDYDYATRAFSNISADQRAIDSSSVAGQDVGDYMITLQDLKGVISQAKFFIPDPTTETEGIGNNAGGYGIPKKYSATIQLILARSVQAGDGNIQISHNGQVLFTQKLSDMSFVVLNSNGNNIITPTPEPSFPPFPQMPQSSTLGHTLLLWSPLVLLPVILFILRFLFKKGQANQQTTPPTPPANPPAPPTT